MPECPKCKTNVEKPFKEWDYGQRNVLVLISELNDINARNVEISSTSISRSRDIGGSLEHLSPP